MGEWGQEETEDIYRKASSPLTLLLHFSTSKRDTQP